MEKRKNIQSQTLGWSPNDYYWSINSIYLIMLTIAIVSILVISFFAWITNQSLSFRICPICAGVSGTWIWLLASRFLGYEIDLIILALLMGGSVVGLSSKLDKNWKIPFIPLGFIATYNLLLENWTILLISLVILSLLSFAFLLLHKKSNLNKETNQELEQKMKNCC